MADSGGGIKQFTEEIEQTGEEVVSDVKDEFGQALEQGVQSITGQTLTSQQIHQQQQQIQQQQMEDQKKLAKVRRDLKWYKDIGEAQRKVREEAKQKEMQRPQEEEAKKQRKQIKVIEQKEKKQTVLAPTPISNIENKNRMAA